MTKTLVIYFSQTGTTQRLAQLMASQLDADLYELKAQAPYSKRDLDWTDDHSRANQEQGDASSRPAIAGSLPDVTPYERIIIGHPTWWGRPPRIIETLLERLDLSGKQVATFATSGGSDYHKSQAVISHYLPQALSGQVLNSPASAKSWLSHHHLS